MSGVFGMFDSKPADVGTTAYLGLYALQHRGQQSAGIVVSDGKRMSIHKGMGLVSQVFQGESIESLKGRTALGHVRHSPADEPHAANAQPLLTFTRYGQVALAHDGNLTNTHLLRSELMGQGAVFQTTTDSELLVHLVAHRDEDSFPEAIFQAAKDLEGAYAVVAIDHRRLIGLRDPLGIRPLSIGKRNDTWFIASESCAFDTVGADLVRDVRPGEMVVIDESGLSSYSVRPASKEAFCVFEYIYFARADSIIGGKTVHEVRKEIGRMLSRQAAVQGDVVIPAPDSALSAAIGYAQEAQIPFDVGLAKNRYVGRTFIQPSPDLRNMGVRIKLNPISETVKGRRVILVDDSIVRGTTSANTIQLLRERGVTEVHMMVASPPFSHPCRYGIDVPTSDQLIASDRTVEEICRLVGADSLTYLSTESLYQAVGISDEGLCTACLTGDYPVAVDLNELMHADPLETRPVSQGAGPT